MENMTALKCDFCNGSLIMDDSREFATCEYCGTKYMKSTIQQKIQEIRGSVTVQGNVSVKEADFTITAGVLKEYNGESSDVIIPNNVLYIGNGAFKNCKGLRSVTISNSVVEIEFQAFAFCENLSSVLISDSVRTIKNFAFAGCNSLTSVIIPNGVTELGDSAFSECSNLQKICVPSQFENNFVFRHSPTKQCIWSGCKSERFVSSNNDTHTVFNGVLSPKCSVCPYRQSYYQVK